jgi:hypothetical protein
LQVGNVQMAFEEIANRNHAHLRPDPSGWQTSTVQPVIDALSRNSFAVPEEHIPAVTDNLEVTLHSA